MTPKIRPTEAEVLAEPAGVQLNAWVAQYVLGKCVRWFGAYWPEIHKDGRPVPNYSTDWAAVGPLLESIEWPVEIEIYPPAWIEPSAVEGSFVKMRGVVVPCDPAKLRDICRAICVALVVAALRAKESPPCV